jgi:osmoprotectant transport system substrate-binding protein
LTATALLLCSVMLAACDQAREDVSEQPAGSNLRLTLGSKNFTESIVMGELYTQALEQNGFQVVLRKNIGGTEVIDQELQDGEIDAYPEYIGLAASEVAGEDVMGKSAEETSELAAEFYATRDQVLSEETPFENTEAVAVMTPFALSHRLRTIEDLRKLPSFTFGARPEFEARQQGFAGMQSVYRLTNAQFVPIAVDARFVALFEGDVDAGNVFSTDPQLASGDYRVLEDTQRLFGYQHVALVIGEEKLESLGGDKFMRVINTVNEQLSQSTIIELNAAVDLDNRDVADVAGDFLAQRDLFQAG